MLYIAIVSPVIAADNYILNFSLKQKSSNATYVIFHLESFPKYRVFTVSNPERLVVDFQNCQLKKPIKLYSNDFFKTIRVGNNNSDLRVVFDSKVKIQIYDSTIINPNSKSSGYKLLIEVGSSEFPVNNLDSLISSKILKNNNVNSSSQKYAIKKSQSQKIEARSTKIPVVVIDAGHGGKDPGAVGRYARTKEKNITLAYAKELKRYLDQTGKYRVYLTRQQDYFIALNERVNIARKLRADLFVSLHADSSGDKNTTGLSIYTLSENSSDKEAEKLALKENKSDIIGGANFTGASGDILKTLISLSQRSAMNSSAVFAETSIKTLRTDRINVLQNTHRFAGFRVLTAPDMASVLIELGYLSNKYEEKRLNNISYRRQIAKSMTKAIDSYFNGHK